MGPTQSLMCARNKDTRNVKRTFHVIMFHRVTGSTVSRRPLTMEARVRFLASLCETCGGQSGTATVFFSNFFGFTLSMSNHKYSIFVQVSRTLWGRDSSVGIAIRYGLDSAGIESRWRQDIPHPADWPWSPPSLLYNGYRVFLGGKAAGAWHRPPTPSSDDVQERVEL